MANYTLKKKKKSTESWPVGLRGDWLFKAVQVVGLCLLLVLKPDGGTAPLKTGCVVMQHCQRPTLREATQPVALQQAEALGELTQNIMRLKRQDVPV